MEMTTYQAIFAVLLIFFLGDLVGAITKAKISSMFVIMMGFLVLFMTGVYPANIMEISGFSAVASAGQYFLLFNMGTSVDIPTLKREWRTVLCATVGMAAAIVGCAVVIPFIGKEYAMAAAPVVNGGIVATTTMVNACEGLGLDTAAALATFVYAVQKFVGTLPASNCGLAVAKDLVNDLRAKHAADPGYSWYAEREGTAGSAVRAFFWEKYKKYYTTFICLAVAAGMMLLANILGDLCQGWVNMSIWCMVLGIICRNTGLVPSITQQTLLPLMPKGRPSSSSWEGLSISCRPWVVISNMPISLVEPYRFFTARKMRYGSVLSPSKYSTVSTICSITLGPAMAPSLFTWPTIKVGISRRFATFKSREEHSLT